MSECLIPKSFLAWKKTKTVLQCNAFSELGKENSFNIALVIITTFQSICLNRENHSALRRYITFY